MLRLENLTVKLGEFQLGGVDLHVKKGEYRVVLGSTGTGKTVLLETVSGLHAPCKGKIFLRGRDITGLAPEKRNLGIVYQDYALFPHMNVENNIAFGLKMRNMDRGRIKEDVWQIAEFLNLEHLLKRTPRHLSGGERQRAALARALVMKPYMLLLDEPLSALDRLTRDRLKIELKRIHADLGITVLHITHDLSEAFLLADTLAVMKDGQVLQEGAPEQILEHPANRLVAELIGIRNFIPAFADKSGMIHMEGMGSVPARAFASAPNVSNEKILISIPDWAVTFSPGADTGPYLWEGEATVRQIDYTGTHIEAIAELPGGKDIRVSFSRREAALISPFLRPGEPVRCRIDMAGVHWIPAE